MFWYTNVRLFSISESNLMLIFSTRYWIARESKYCDYWVDILNIYLLGWLFKFCEFEYIGVLKKLIFTLSWLTFHSLLFVSILLG